MVSFFLAADALFQPNNQEARQAREEAMAGKEGAKKVEVKPVVDDKKKKKGK